MNNSGKIISCDNKFHGVVHTIGVYLKMFFILLFISKYDTIHIHSVKTIQSFFAELLRKKCNKLVCTIYGSDFYRISDKERNKLSKLFKYSDYITIETLQTIEDFNNFYKDKYADKIVNIRFGIAAVEKIKKLKNEGISRDCLKPQFHIPKDSFVITVGYNATKEQNHITILKQLKAIEDKLPDNYFIVIPLGYGNKDYGRSVEEYFASLDLNGECLFDFYNIESIAGLRLVSNIMIQLQDTDSLSSSMMEYLYAGNIIITGAWLPYLEIKEYIISIEKLDGLADQLEKLLSDWDGFKGKLVGSNYKEFIEKNFIWSNVKNQWEKLYEYSN